MFDPVKLKRVFRSCIFWRIMFDLNIVIKKTPGALAHN
jgi:hypothetical protein